MAVTMLTLCPRPGHSAHTVSFTSPNVLKFRPYAHCWFSSLAHTSKMNGLRPDHTLSWCGNDIHSQVYHQYPHCQHYVRLPLPKPPADRCHCPTPCLPKVRVGHVIGAGLFLLCLISQGPGSLLRLLKGNSPVPVL